MKLFNKINFGITTISAAVILMTGSCSKRLDIYPYQSIGSDVALLTESDVNATLIGCYDGIQSTSVYGGDLQLFNALTGNKDDINFTGTFAPLNDAYNAAMSSNNTYAASTWAGVYNAINRCNYVLSALDKVTSSPENRDRVEGEATFLRASMLFDLVKLYAKFYGDGDYASNPGVPIITTPTTEITEANYVSRNSVKEVYDFVIAELTKAQNLLPEDNSRYATKFTAAAMLSRVYMVLGNYTAAREAANFVIENSGKSLETDFEDLWFTEINGGGTTPEEYIFFVKITTQDGINDMNTFFGRTISAIPGTSGRSDCKIKDAHRAKYEAGDVRGAFFQLSGGNYYTKKHLDTYGDVLVIRLAEMYLTRAEANVRLGESVGATPKEDVNLIRERAGLDPLDVVDLPAVLKERYLEFAFEGQALSESKRLKQPVSGLAWNSPKLIWPIPQRETDVNKNLVQNEGY
ncbi:RagB/SusD family nutrient uptake outer membrane protein [Pollutibacter soli]|uniref:RagB/SusD family nutrient uptake outer membrane protein n=1 Tax=Pollutibacter soli TaxID=3034157 RepID=UPI0030133367